MRDDIGILILWAWKNRRRGDVSSGDETVNDGDDKRQDDNDRFMCGSVVAWRVLGTTCTANYTTMWHEKDRLSFLAWHVCVACVVACVWYGGVLCEGLVVAGQQQQHDKWHVA